MKTLHGLHKWRGRGVWGERPRSSFADLGVCPLCGGEHEPRECKLWIVIKDIPVDKPAEERHLAA